MTHLSTMPGRTSCVICEREKQNIHGDWGCRPLRVERTCPHKQGGNRRAARHFYRQQFILQTLYIGLAKNFNWVLPYLLMEKPEWTFLFSLIDKRWIYLQRNTLHRQSMGRAEGESDLGGNTLHRSTGRCRRQQRPDWMLRVRKKESEEITGDNTGNTFSEPG